MSDKFLSLRALEAYVYGQYGYCSKGIDERIQEMCQKHLLLGNSPGDFGRPYKFARRFLTSFHISLTLTLGDIARCVL